MTLTDVKTRLSQLGYEAQASEETALQFLIDKVTAEILDRCNISAIPENLDKAVVDRICAEYLRQLLDTGKLTGYSFEDGVKSITEGDSSVTYLDGDSAESKFVSLLSAMISDCDEQVLCYRKMRW